LVALLEKVQPSRTTGTRIAKKDKREAVLMIFRCLVAPSTARDLAAARKLMGVDPNAREATATYWAAPMAPQLRGEQCLHLSVTSCLQNDTAQNDFSENMST
jgi:hypothetical protein